MLWSRISLRGLLGAVIGLCLLVAPRVAVADSRPFLLYMLTNPNGAPNGVVGFTVDAAGAVSPIAGSPFSTGGSGMASVAGADYSHRIALSRSSNRLFAANELQGSIAVFNVDTLTGVLSAVPGSPFTVANWAGNPGISLAVSNDGKFLYGSSTSVVSFSVAANGSLTEIGARWTFSSRVNGSVVSDANDYLYLAMSDRVSALKTGSTGLTFGTPTNLSLGNVPTDVALNHAGDTLYVGSSSAINAFRVTPSGSGGLSFTPLVGAPYFGGSSNLSGLALDFYDRVLVAYGSTGPNLAAGVLSPSGVLSPGPGSPFPPSLAPSGAVLSPEGGRLFTSTAASQLDSWSVDDAGALVHTPGYPIGLGFSSGFSKLVAFPDKTPTATPALPLGATVALILGLLSVVPSRRRRYRSCCRQSSDS